MDIHDYDLIAVGGGTAGLVAAAGAAYLGARPALVESRALGGDCLWHGCVPSKALLASARRAYGLRTADALGLRAGDPAPDLARVMRRVRDVRERVAHHDDPERFRSMGVDVRFGAARFVADGTLEVDGVGRLRSKRIIVATGAGPAVPPLPGLEEAGFLTYEDAFEADRIPDPLLVLGGGPIGVELAQAYARLGLEVTLLEMEEEILPREDPEAGQLLREILEREGVRVVTGVRATEVRLDGNAPDGPPPGRDARESRPRGAKTVLTADGGRLEAAEILVAVGRSPTTGDLDLQRTGVEREGAAIRVDDRLRTTARGVWAAGDVAGGPQFTHVAEYHAKVALRNALLPFSTRVDYAAVPRVTYTDPEVAHVGWGEAEARERGARTYRYDLAELDRALCDGETAGFVKIHAGRKGRVLGATVVGHRGGEMIFPLAMAIEHGVSLSSVAETVFPYPTHMEGVKRAAQEYQRSRLEGAAGRLLRAVVRWLA